MKKVYHILSFTLILTLFLSAGASGEIIGIDKFDYADGDIEGKAGGQGWDWDNTTSTHTGTVSDWNYLFGSAVVQANALVTNNEGEALREYNGPTEGVDGDEGLGAFRAVGRVYYGVTMIQLSTNDWCGFSGYDFGEERVFFGQPWQGDSPRYFGVEVTGDGAALSNIEVVVNEPYYLIGAQDFDGDQLRLWVNPDSSDYDNGPADNTADVTIAYTYGDWNSAVRFASGSQTRWDDVMVSNSFGDLIHNAAINPYPADGAINVKLDVTLSWDPARDPDNPDLPNPDITRHFLYMSNGTADPNLYFVAEVPNDGSRAQYGPLSLDMDKKYKWRVDEGIADLPAGDPNNIEGYVWRFAAVTTKPVIDPDYPVDQLVDAGGSAEFTVIASNPFTGYETEVAYQWYKDDVVLTDGVTTHGSTISGATSDVLTISNVQMEDEGQYFCRVTNTYGNTAEADSPTARLTIKRMLAYWPFDIENDSNSVVAGSPVTNTFGDPQFVSGITGGAFQFDGDDAFYTEIAEADYFEACDRNMTICCFMKSAGQTEWTPFVSKYGESGLGWQLRQNGFTSDRVSFTTRGTGAEDGSYSSMSLYDDQWHFVVGTFDSVEKKLYIDGMLDQTDAVTGPVTYSTSPAAIAARVWEDGGWWVDGFATVTLDEVRIYNYSMDKFAIADLYINAAGGYVCAEGYPEADLDKNCRVDLNDFAIMAAKWLECGLYPVEGNCP